MGINEKQIIGENAKYVSDTIPQETKEGLRTHLKPGYAMPDGTHYATGKDYTELMRNLRNIQHRFVKGSLASKAGGELT